MILVYSIAVLCLMGIIFGFVLAYASKRFAVWEDPRVKAIEEILPGANCGACGFAGCHAYAVAIAAGKADLNLCKPGAAEVASDVGKLMGKEVEIKKPMAAQRYCNGGRNETKLKFNYEGIQTCKAASLINNGYKECSYSCLGFGDCTKVCPVNAITMDDNNLPQIDKEKCIGCEKCTKECPRNVLHIAPKKARVHVRCSSHDPAAAVTKVCTVGCIACRQCEKACPFDAIHVIDNVAVIDYSKCKSCGKCVQACPRKIIEQEPLPEKEKKKQEPKDKPEEQKAEQPAEEKKE